MKVARIIACFMALALILAQSMQYPAYGETEMRISAQKKDEGVVSVAVRSNSGKTMRVGVHAKESDLAYYFTYRAAEGEIDVPLMFGNGKYEITLYEEIENKLYEQLDSYDMDLQLADYDTVYLSSSVIVNWVDEANIKAKAEELTSNKNSDYEKYRAIHKYVVENIVYDKTKTTESGYRSSPDETLKNGSGICLDIAVLYAAMMRSVGIKCKLVIGDAKDVSGLHSWNKVFIRGRWLIVDPTKDSQFYESNIPYKYAKLSRDYIDKYTF